MTASRLTLMALSLLFMNFESVKASSATSVGKILQPMFKSAPDCTNRPEFLTEIRSDFSSSLAHLPPTLLVARDVEYYVESVDMAEGIKMHGYQSLLRKGSSPRIICGSSSAHRDRFSLVAPTLINTHKMPRVGESLWQFQLMTEGDKFSFWNLKTSSFGAKVDVESILRSSGATYKVYQKSHNEFELLVTKKTGAVTQYLSIRYDAIAN